MFLRFLFFLLILATAVIVLATDDAPALQRDATLSPTAIAQARWLFLSNDPRRLKAGEVRRVGIPASLFDQGVNYLASRRLPARGGFTIEGQQALIRISLPLPAGRHANLSLAIDAPEGQPRLASAQLGALPLPAALVGTLATSAIAASGFQRELELARNALQAVEFDAAGQRVLVTYSWEPALLDRARNIAFDPQDLAALKAAQTDFAASLAYHASGARLPLTDILGPLLKERDRNGRRAVLLVLSAYLAEKNLANLVPQAAQWPKARPVMLTLLGRYDSAQHFAISAALAAWAGEPIADAIGVYKEFADARHGSGFSFADLAADRAGTRFGEAINHESSALAARLSAPLADGDLIPSLDGLPEYLRESEFRRRYGDTNSPAYRALLAEIERRIAALPIHVATPR